MAIPSTPFLIAGVGGGTLGSFSGVQWGSVNHNGQIWEFVSEPSPNDTVLGAYLLNAQQNAFTLQGGATSGPSSHACAMFWDGSSNLAYFLWNDNDGNNGIRPFNLDTKTWGADIAVDPSLDLDAPVALWKRSDGSFIGLFLQSGGDELIYTTAIFDGTSWSSPIDITVSAAGLGFNAYDNATSILDSENNLWTIFHASDGNQFFLQQVKPDGTLGIFQQFAGQSADPQQLNATVTASTMAIVGDSLLWGITCNADGGAGVGVYQFPAIYVGTPLSNPVWTKSGSIDPQSFVPIEGDPFEQPQNPTTFGNLFYSGGILYSIYIRNVYEGGVGPALEGQIMISQTKDPSFLIGWTSASFYDPNASPTLFPAGHTAFGFTPCAVFGSPLQAMAVDYTDTTAVGPEQRYFVGGGLSPIALPITLRGVKRIPLNQDCSK